MPEPCKIGQISRGTGVGAGAKEVRGVGAGVNTGKV